MLTSQEGMKENKKHFCDKQLCLPRTTQNQAVPSLTAEPLPCLHHRDNDTSNYLVEGVLSAWHNT